MLTKDTKKKQNASTDPKALQRIMHSLQRLIKIGIYYPSGHSTLDGAIEQFLDSLKKVAGDNPSIRFTIKNEELLLQGIVLDHTHFFVREFRETLANLAITYLEIDREITPSEVQMFIASLLAYKTRFASTKEFVHIELTELPISVRISQTEYLSTQGDHESSNESQPTLESIMESLVQQGLHQEQVDQCRQFLETASIHSLQPQVGQKTTQHSSWKDVEKLLLNLVLSSELSPENPESPYFKRDLNHLTAILGKMDPESTKKNPIEAVNLLISLVKKSSQPVPVPEDKGKGKLSKEIDLFPVSDIKDFLKKNFVPATQFQNFYEKDRCEILCIVMQLLNYRHSLQVQVRIQLMIREILTTPLETEEWDIIIHGVHQLLQNKEIEDLQVPLTMILEALRKSQKASSLALLERVGQNCISVELKKLLPYLVNEILLVGSQENPKLFNELCNIALFLPPSDLFESLPILEKLDAFMESNIATSLFYSINPTHYPLFAPLLNTTIAELLSKRIIQGFTNKPPSGIIDALLPLLDNNTPQHRQFLHEYLINSRFSKPTKSLQSFAYQIIFEKLLDIPKEERKNLQLLKTIKILPHLYGENIHLLLHTIITKKRLFFIPEWPSYCRNMAKEALSAYLIIKKRGKQNDGR